MFNWRYWLGGGLLLATVLAWLGRFGPLFELLPNVRSQILIVSVLAVLVLGLARAPKAAALAFVAVVINGFYVVPYFASSSPDRQADPSAEITVFQFNIFFGNEDTQAIADHVLEADADIVVLHELLPSQWDVLEPALTNRYPHAIAEPLGVGQGQLGGGMAILAAQPLTRQPVSEAASPIDRVLLKAETNILEQNVTVVGLHPHASRFESRKIELRDTQIDAVVDMANQADGKVIVATDLNITPTSPTYQSFLDETGWADPHRAIGWQPSWPTWGSFVGFPIDHVFVSNELALVDYETRDGAGSDHRSVLATIVAD